ncbi:unnamed protein product [Cylicostephanus goldi]|uniref:Uncharacterized protein n=1 Tax=Cylicostephanus goldi TaxID=71465 RepID=A0A3P6T355_CYLGO|nr:unnamed protein product [Cylicostephanus goldi]
MTGMGGAGLMGMGFPPPQMMRMGGPGMPGLVPSGQGKPGNEDSSPNVPK